MVVHTVYAVIVEGAVANAVVGGYTECNQYARDVYGSEAYAVEVTQIPVEIGDTYVDGNFFHNGVFVQPVPTDTQEIANLKADNAALRMELDTVSLAVLDIIGMEE